MKLIAILTILIFSISTFAMEFAAPTATARTNSKVTLSFDVTDAVDILAFQGNIVFDPTVLTPVGCSIGDLNPNFQVVCNLNYAPGVVRFAEYSWDTINGDGTVLNIKFYTHKGTSDIRFDDILFFNEQGYTPVKLVDGFINLE